MKVSIIHHKAFLLEERVSQTLVDIILQEK